ncbi:hypothetical protein K438DRAFT_1973957 [Mycena galopus ATCC 62051]|nr:hypothetical protein K438DRAFT_1973957 [Mycena galopus ATCC 62051]
MDNVKRPAFRYGLWCYSRAYIRPFYAPERKEYKRAAPHFERKTTGFEDITFPMTIVEADHFSGYYFAKQFTFGNSSIGYTGRRPRPDSGGLSGLHGVFSSFIVGTTTTDPNCKNGADGGAGVSCGIGNTITRTTSR